MHPQTKPAFRHIPARGQNVRLDTRAAILRHYIFRTLPAVQRLLGNWKRQAGACPDPELRRQALASINSKAFHCQGGAVYAVPGREWEPALLSFIVAYQTLCDYLDNLCDRAGSTDGQAFAQLHLSLIDALNPNRPQQDYYRHYPWKNDGGYISRLVDTCRESLGSLPAYALVQEEASRLADWYCQLQVYKHLSLESREAALTSWANSCRVDHPQIGWQEFSAACGSTLALFQLVAMAACPQLQKEHLQPVMQAYFPWICGLHILLDYFIDREEDRRGGDLNFTFYYADELQMRERLQLFIIRCHRAAGELPEPVFHRTVVDGLLAMYLSDRKVKTQGFGPLAGQLLKTSGPLAFRTYRLCRLVRIFL